MMNTLTPTAPPELPPPQEMKALFGLLQIIADPAGAKKRLEEIAAATAAAGKQIETMRSAKLDALRAEHAEALADAKAKHDREIAADQAEHDAAVAKREREIEAAEKRVAELSAQATSNAHKVAELKATYEKRLSMMRMAADVT